MKVRHIAFIMLLAGCQSPPVVYDVPTSRSYDRDTRDVWTDLIAAVGAQGLSIVEADRTTGRLVATLTDYAPRGWAACRPARVIDRHDDKSRRGRGRPVDRMLDLTVQLEETDGRSKIGMRANFSERQINPFKNLPFQVGCRSTGELERGLFATLDGT